MKIIEDLHRAKQEQRLCVFVGAGISKSSENDGAKFPSWSDLIEALQKELNLEHEHDYLKLAQSYYLEHGDYLYYRKLKSFFNIDASPSLVHKSILELEPKNIITTNWDCLLEKSISENLELYDIIVSDEDLSKSSLPNKLVKMHGDFNHHNIIFKEDDYLNYEHNSPLISNYIKGVLSTNAVLFIGYSYNDIDLKLIMMWLRNHAKSRQPIYLLTFSENKSKIKYLENHGIKTIVLTDLERKIPRLDNYSSIIYDFISKIVSYKNFNAAGSIDPIAFVYGKIRHLSNLKKVLYEQVSSALGNCGYEYYPNLTLFIFYNNILTTDYNKETRTIFNKFVSGLEENEEKFIMENHSKIFSILSKASISGISLSKDENNSKFFKIPNHSINNELESNLSFHYPNTPSNIDDLDNLLYCSQLYYYSENYQSCLNLLETALRLAISKKHYAAILISSSNYNELRRIISIKDNNVSLDDKKYKDVDGFYNSFPYEIKLDNFALYNTLRHTYIKERAFKVFSLLKKNEKQRSIITRGGFYFSKENETLKSEHKNMLHYFLGNNILIEHLTEFKDINKYYVEGSFNSQCQKSKIELDKEEIYSLIKFFKNTEIKDLFYSFGVREGEAYDFLSISEENLRWLINDVLVNLVNHIKSITHVNTLFWGYIENFIYILSFIKVNGSNFDKFLNCINMVINGSGVPYMFYSAVNQFLAMQFNLFGSDFDKNMLKETIEAIIDKFSIGKANGYEYMAIRNYCIDNFFGLAKEKSIEITNEKSIRRLIFEMNYASIDYQCKLASSLLLSLLEISNSTIKEILEEAFYNLTIKIKNQPSLEGVTFYLTLIASGFEKYETEAKEALETLLKTIDKRELHSASLYEIERLLNFLSIEKNLTDYQNIYKNNFTQEENL
ncbi:SIR2 family protein [Serratia sp. D1N4]